MKQTNDPQLKGEEVTGMSCINGIRKGDKHEIKQPKLCKLNDNRLFNQIVVSNNSSVNFINDLLVHKVHKG